MSELKLDLSDLEVESISSASPEEINLNDISGATAGQGIAEIGASCCTIVCTVGSCVEAETESPAS